MALFQSSVLKKYLAAQEHRPMHEAFAAYLTYFHNPRIRDNIRAAKEEQFQEGFLRELFVKIFGYTINPEPDFNLTTELKNIKDSKKTDGAILKDGNALAVIELKGTDTKDLDKIRDQAFNYKNNQPECVYVITSNFEKLRFYIDNAVDYVEFNILAMESDQFKLMWLLLQKDNLLSGLPKKIKEESLLAEEQITKQLYRDYSAFKQELWQDLVAQNPGQDELLLYKKSQKLLDRFLFIFFAEDKGLLPPNSIMEIVNQWVKLKELDEYRPIYERFKKYFGYLNTGRVIPGKPEIHAYNGGLFAPDPILDTLTISDSVLERHVRKLTEYDFESEVDTNILGHIFEHSLNDIENVRAMLAGQEVDKSKTKRKRDGVFYTPKYITKYIVDNTLGRLCTEKKAELQLVDEEFSKYLHYKTKEAERKRKTELKHKLDTYRNWLLQLTICDPACGSGAFLNQVLEFLIAEHRYVDELEAQLFDSPLVLPNVENHILENNIFGVDINEESVEIARLSLWLRTAKKGRKLSSLNSNIKVGNSLIDDPAVAGDLAFDWQAQFPQVFAKGGFDVVVGNPPYVRLESIKEISEQLSKLNYVTFDKRGDLYQLFVEKGITILRTNGSFSYIMPNKWLQAGYGKSLREYFLKYNLTRLIDFGDFQIFDGATTYPCIFILRKEPPTKELLISVLQLSSSSDFESYVNSIAESFDIASLSGETWVISSKSEQSFLSKLNQKFTSLGHQLAAGTYRGILTGLTEAFLISDETKNLIIKRDSKSSRFIFPFLQGRDIKSYVSAEPSSHIILFPKGFTHEQIGISTEEHAWNWLMNSYPGIGEWLLPFEKRGKNRTDKGDYWWELRACDYYKEFEKPKIMYQKFQVKPCFIYDTSGYYCNDSMWIIPTDSKALLGLLNSKMGWWLINKYCTQIQNGCQLIWKYFSQIPLPNLEEALELVDKVDLRISLTSNFETITRQYLVYIKSKFSIEKPSTKLQNWPDLDFKGFLGELSKAKVKLSLSEEAEWMAYFNEQKAKALALQADITRLDREIDALVYELYGLTEEEIKIVEGGDH